MHEGGEGGGVGHEISLVKRTIRNSRVVMVQISMLEEKSRCERMVRRE